MSINLLVSNLRGLDRLSIRSHNRNTMEQLDQLLSRMLEIRSILYQVDQPDAATQLDQQLAELIDTPEMDAMKLVAKLPAFLKHYQDMMKRQRRLSYDQQ